MNAKEAVNNLKIMSDTLAKVANKPHFYNTEYGYFLEQFSHQLYRDANELDQIESLLGMPNAINMGWGAVMETKYRIFNFRKQVYVGGLYACRKRASHRADKLDLEYGAISFRVVEVKE